MWERIKKSPHRQIVLRRWQIGRQPLNDKSPRSKPPPEERIVFFRVRERIGGVVARSLFVSRYDVVPLRCRIQEVNNVVHDYSCARIVKNIEVFFREVPRTVDDPLRYFYAHDLLQ